MHNNDLKLKVIASELFGRELDKNTSSLDVIQKLNNKSNNIVRSDKRTRTNIQGTVVIRDNMKKFTCKGEKLFFNPQSNSNSQGSLNKSHKSYECDKVNEEVGQNLFEKVVQEMENKFNISMKENFIDHVHNIPDFYEDYVVENLKVIKRMQFFMNQASYDEVYSRKRAEITKNFSFDYSQPYLIFDLDETLIHSEAYKPEEEKNYDKIVEFEINEGYNTAVEKLGVYIRPYTEEFLSWASENFRLILFTAAEIQYANHILKAFNLDRYFEIILDRSYTIEVKGFYVKDLTLFNSLDKLNCVIIDNNIFSFSATLDQGILISSYYNDREDVELKDLKTYFEETIIPNIDNMVSTNSEYYMYQELMLKIQYEEERS